MERTDYDRVEIKNDLTRLLVRYGPKKVADVWTQTIDDLRGMLRDYDAGQTVLPEPELIYQREEVPKKQRKPRQKKSDVIETSQ